MRRHRFITGYSGLRALAVIGVILYHLDPNLFMGGYLGCADFFRALRIFGDRSYA